MTQVAETKEYVSSELKPCPFCGEQPELRGSVIGCANKKCWGPSIWHMANPEDSIAAWNRRAAEAEPMAFMVHDEPELGDYLTKSRKAADDSGKRVTPLYATPPASTPVGATEERLEKAARAIMEQDACGYTINGLRCLCDDALSEGLVDGYNKPLRQSICGCRESAKAALTAALTEVSNAG